MEGHSANAFENESKKGASASVDCFQPNNRRPFERHNAVWNRTAVAKKEWRKFSRASNG